MTFVVGGERTNVGRQAVNGLRPSVGADWAGPIALHVVVCDSAYILASRDSGVTS